MQAKAEYQAHMQKRHDSAAHLLAEAIQKLFPGVQFANKHANAEGFLCEIALEQPLAPADLAALEQYMAQLVERGAPCSRAYWSRAKALEYFRRQGQADNIAQLEQAPDDEASPQVYAANHPQLCGSWPNDEWPADVLIYQHGEFIDLCSAPHVEYAHEIGACKLLRVAQVRDGKGLQRVYGMAEG